MTTPRSQGRTINLRLRCSELFKLTENNSENIFDHSNLGSLAAVARQYLTP